MFPTWQWSCFPCMYVDVHPASHSLHLISHILHPISHLLYPTICTCSGRDGYELELLGFASVSSLMEFIQPRKGGLGSASSFLILMIQSFPFLLDQGAGTTSTQLAAGSTPYPTFHILFPMPHILYPNSHTLFVILHPTSNIVHPARYVPPSNVLYSHT